jgi:hypothetical protein
MVFFYQCVLGEDGEPLPRTLHLLHALQFRAPSNDARYASDDSGVTEKLWDTTDAVHNTSGLD